MVRREELLQILEREKGEEIIQFIQQCKSDGAGCLTDTLASCSRKQLDNVWSVVSQVFSQSLLIVPDDFDSEEGSQTLNVIECVTSLMAAMLAQKEFHVPDGMIQMASLLQDVVSQLPVSMDKVKNGLTRVFEDWWKKNLPNKDSVIMTSFVYIVERSLDLKPKPLVADMKRVWSLHEVVQLVELHNASSNEFKTLLQRCFIAPQYMQHDEGVKFLAYLMTLDEEFTHMIHSTIKNHLLSVPRAWSERYGEIYFRAWQTGTLTQKLEQDCIQDLMYHAVHAQPILAPVLRKLLSYIHRQKKQRGVDDMLLRLYEPFIWRSLRVANSQVRANAAWLFFNVFPLQSHDLPVQEADSLLQKQFDLFQELIMDPFPSIRIVSVLGVFRVMEKYWELIPQDALKNLTVKLVQDLLNDTSSADVRESVVKGLCILLDNHLCHLFLKPVLPEIRNSFHDVSEKVRVAMLELLEKVKSIRTIKYWNIVPREHLLARLVVDSDPVNKRIMKLIFGNFVPIDASIEEKLNRCITLITLNPAAARQFFRYAPQHMSINDTVNYISMLCKVMLSVTMRSDVFQNKNKEHEQNAEDQVSENDVDDDVDDDDDDELRISNTPLMKGLCEAMCILLTVSDSQLKKASNAQLNKSLQKKFSYALPEMMKVFTDPDIVNVLVQIAAFLPANYIPTISRTWLPKLRNMTSDSTEESYADLLECLCKNGCGPEVIELIVEWLSPELGADNGSTTANKAKKRKKKVGFVEPKVAQPKLGLDMLAYLLRGSVTQDILLTNHLTDVITVKNMLQKCLERMERLFTDGQTNVDTELLTTSFTLYCKVCLLIHLKSKKEHNCVREFEDLLGWTDKHALPILSIKSEDVGSDSLQTNKKLVTSIICDLLNIFNNMLLVGVGDCAICNKLVDFCTACLVADEDLELLPLSMLCLYQVTEFIQYQPDTADTVTNTIPNALSRILVVIAGYVKHNKTNCHKLLPSVTVYFGELMKVVFGRLSLDTTFLQDVMGTLMAAILAELAYYSQDDDLPEDTGFTTLPPLSGWLFDILLKKKQILRYFLDELTDCCDSGAVSDLHKIHGTVHLLNCLAAGKKTDGGLKELWTVAHKQMETIKNSLDEEQAENFKSVILTVEEKLKRCQQLLNTTPST